MTTIQVVQQSFRREPDRPWSPSRCRGLLPTPPSTVAEITGSIQGPYSPPMARRRVPEGGQLPPVRLGWGPRRGNTWPGGILVNWGLMEGSRGRFSRESRHSGPAILALGRQMIPRNQGPTVNCSFRKTNNIKPKSSKGRLGASCELFVQQICHTHRGQIRP